MEKFLKYKDVQEIFGVSRQTVNVWVREGLLKVYRPTKGTVRFREKDIYDFLQSGSKLAQK